MSAAYDYRKYAVLYVDDEEQALKYFRKGLDKDLRVLTASGVADAAALLERDGDQIGVVITDQRMPGGTGVELLKLVREKRPQIVRLLITAYADIDSAIDAVNSGAIYKYITKPADLKALREILLQAMELFLRNAEQQTLLKERLAVIQRMVVADRVRSLAAMAGGISHHLRNSMTALTCFLEEAAAAGQLSGGLAADPQFAQQLWQLAQKEREHLVQIVRKVGQGVTEPSCRQPVQVDAADLIRDALSAAAPEIAGKQLITDFAGDLPRLELDPACITQLMKILVGYVVRLSKLEAKLTVSCRTAPVNGTPGISIRVSGNGAAWTDGDVASFFTPFAFPSADPSDLGVDLLVAFFTAYQHGGDVLIHQAPPAGPGFELLLPADPAAVKRTELEDGLMQKLFTRLSAVPGKAA